MLLNNNMVYLIRYIALYLLVINIGKEIKSLDLIYLLTNIRNCMLYNYLLYYNQFNGI